MAGPIHCNRIASISELKQNPEKTMASGKGEAIAILSYNKPLFYCVPLELFERLSQAMERTNSQV
ncbi:hypothetical protein AAGW04_18265 [Pectobacterium aroidearum]|uniref:hypothetical protein n=1 Tax=Pectobacterium aroidearum TaxID=1201031 RepID=UPI003159874C